MKFKSKSSNQSADPREEIPIETLISYRNKVIPLLTSQKHRLMSLNYSHERPDFEGMARKAVYNAMKSPEGSEAEKCGYSTEMFRHLYAMALSQLMTNKPLRLEILDPVPSDWKAIGAYRKAKTSTPAKKPETAFKTPIPSIQKLLQSEANGIPILREHEQILKSHHQAQQAYENGPP